MWFLALLGCPDEPRDDGPGPGTATTSDTGDTGTAPPPADEVACSGADEDRDGLPGSDEPCVGRRPDVELLPPPTDACCLRWSLIPDQTGDGRTDVLLEQIYDVGADAVGASAWILPATESGDAEDLATATVAVTPGWMDWAAPNGAAVGEYDGAPGADVWIRGHLFTGRLEGELRAEDAIAVLDGGSPDLSGDLDGDGVDDLAKVSSLTTGSYHSGGYHTTYTLDVARGPFGDGAGWEEVTERTGRTVGLLDADGDDTPELVHATSDADGAPTVVHGLGGREVARFAAPITGVGDLDGDGFDDAYVAEASTERVARWFAGPFEGTFDPDTHPMVVSWKDLEHPGALPDLDGDGRAELVWSSLFGGFGIAPAASGDQGVFAPEASRWRKDGVTVNQVPTGGPFVGNLGADPAADLAVGVITGRGTWNGAFQVYFQPLY